MGVWRRTKVSEGLGIVRSDHEDERISSTFTENCKK